MIILLIFFLIVALLIMIWACDSAINNAVILGKNFGINDLFMGIFIIAIGTSLPEFAATIQAIQIGAPGIVAGNLVGSNIANILLVGGVMLIPIKPYEIEDRDKISLHYFILISIIFSFTLFTNFNLTYIAIPIIMILLGIFLYIELKKNSKKNSNHTKKDSNNNLLIIKIIISFVVLYFSSKYFIGYAKSISNYFGIADTIVGVSIVALGTSLPEVITTIIALYKKKKNMALGNIIGSCIANITIITLTAIILGGSINFYLLLDDFNKLVFIATAFVFYIAIIKKVSNRITATLSLLLYIIYIFMLYL